MGSVSLAQTSSTNKADIDMAAILSAIQQIKEEPTDATAVQSAEV